MRIVIDLQGAQTESRFGGDRYSLLIAQAIVRNRGRHEVVLALSGLFPKTIESIRAAFDGLLPQENVHVWYAPGPVRACEPGNVWRRDVAERIREAFLASLKADIVFIPSFFKGYHDDGVTSIKVFANDLTTVVVLSESDFIPSNTDLQSECLYSLSKMNQLKGANLLLVESKLTLDRLCQHLGISQESTNVFSTAMVLEIESQVLDIQANKIINRFESLIDHSSKLFLPEKNGRPRLAYVSPLPPVRSGISDYSAELLPELARFYDIDVVVAQSDVTDSWILAHCKLRNIEWFYKNNEQYDRVIYHFGNSPFHQHMFDMLEKIPGVVVLHDFYLGDVEYSRAVNNLSQQSWVETLYDSHGYVAMIEAYRSDNPAKQILKYPANFQLIQQASRMISHSEYSKALAEQWYGNQPFVDWDVIPLLRAPVSNTNLGQARQALGLDLNDFVICSFGLLGSTKHNQLLLDAWLHSLAEYDHCQLIFVGEADNSEYCTGFRETICSSGLGKRIKITGWVDQTTYKNYLASADIAVQLRTCSRGETSAAILDCMNNGLPTIVNANGAMTELPSDAVWMLPDNCDVSQLIEALETLRQDEKKRHKLGVCAFEYVEVRHSPSVCAEQYAISIEKSYAAQRKSVGALVGAIAKLESHYPTDDDCLTISKSIAESTVEVMHQRQLLVDVSAIARNDLKTGIQRVVRALVLELIQSSPKGYRVEPVYLSNDRGEWHYRYAHDWTSSLLGIPSGWRYESTVGYSSGDILLVADFTGDFVVQANRAGVFGKMKNDGVELQFVVYDLLPIQMPEVFPPGLFGFQEWLEVVALVADGVVCISSAVADELRFWIQNSNIERQRPVKIGYFHLGADVQNSSPTMGLPEDTELVLSRIRVMPSFLMVGTIEPRKAHLQTLDAFEQLWREGSEINLVIVGNEGWCGLPDGMRRTIPETVARLKNHPELGNHLFWLQGISDEYLEKIYAASTCLIAASYGEGFGLPLIEAAQHKLPIIARDIPVFREVAGEYACYFHVKTSEELADAVLRWLELHDIDEYPKSDEMPWLSWKECSQQLMNVILSINKLRKLVV